MAMPPPPVPRVPGAMPPMTSPPPGLQRPPVGAITTPMPQPAIEALPGDPHEGAPHVVSIWQTPLMQDVMPFATSLLLHIVLIVLGVIIAKQVVERLSPPKVQVIVPDATNVDGPEGGIPHPGLGGDPNRDAKQDKFPDIQADPNGWADKPSQTISNTVMGGGSGESADSGVIGVSAAGGGYGKGTNKLGSGSGTGFGSGTEGDGGGPLAPFGIPGGGGGIGPKASMFGMGGRARYVCYVCDASGSMLSKFDDLRLEIIKSVAGLAKTQFFNVIFFQNGASIPLSPDKLMVASPENRDKVEKFVNGIACREQTNPIPALEKAFALCPKGEQLMIFFLTDGDFDDNDAVIKWIKDHNTAKNIKINTIAYIDRGEGYEKILQEIANENGGVFKYVSEKDVGR